MLAFCNLHCIPRPYRILPAVCSLPKLPHHCMQETSWCMASMVYSPYYAMVYDVYDSTRCELCHITRLFMPHGVYLTPLWQLFIKTESGIYNSANMTENDAVICKPPYILFLVSRGGAQNGQYSNFQELSLVLPLDIHNVWFYQGFTWRTIKAHTSNV